MDNKQNRQFYWEVKQFLNTSPVPFAPKAASLKDSIGSVLKENSPYKQNNFVKDSGSVNTAKTTLGNHRKVELANLPSCAAYTKNGNTNPFNITEGLLEYTQPNSNNMSTDEKTRLADRMNRAVTNPVYGAVTGALENPVANYMRDVQSGPVGQAINQGLGSAIKTTVDVASGLLDNKYTRAFHDAIDSGDIFSPEIKSGLQSLGFYKDEKTNTAQQPTGIQAANTTQQPTGTQPTSAAPIQPARREPTVRQQPTGTQPTPQQSAPQPGINAAPARNPSQPYRPQYTSNQGPQSGPQSTGSGIRIGNRQVSSSEFYSNKQTGSIMDRLANMDVTKSPGGYSGLPAAGNFNTGPAITLPRMKNKSINSLEDYTVTKSAKADIPQDLDNLHNLNTMSSSSNISQLSGNNAQRGQIVQGMISDLIKGTKTKSEFKYSSGRTI